jgi:hypothetical protein
MGRIDVGFVPIFGWKPPWLGDSTGFNPYLEPIIMDYEWDIHDYP